MSSRKPYVCKSGDRPNPIAAGQCIVLDRIIWREFEDILEDLGKHRHFHIAY